MARLIKNALIFLLPIVIDAVIQVLREKKYEQYRKRYYLENQK